MSSDSRRAQADEKPAAQHSSKSSSTHTGLPPSGVRGAEREQPLTDKIGSTPLYDTLTLAQDAEATRSLPLSRGQGNMDEDGKSVPNTSSALPPRSVAPKADETVTVQAKAIVKLLDKAIQKRTQVDYEQDGLERQHDFFLESSKRLLDALQQAVQAASLPSDSSSAGALQSLLIQCQKDDSDMRQKEYAVRALRSKLSSYEFRLAQQEMNIRTAIQAPATDSSNLTAVNADAFTETSRRSSSHESSETPPLLKQYYSRKGDERIYHERLIELDASYEEGLTTRQLLADRGDPLELSDNKFEDSYQAERANIYDDHQSAKQEASGLAEQCAANKIHIMPTRGSSVNHDDDNEDEENEEEQEAGEQSVGPSLAGMPTATYLSRFALEPGSNQRAVLGWLGDLSRTRGSEESGPAHEDIDQSSENLSAVPPPLPFPEDNARSIAQAKGRG